jgi:hypothetical protein
LAEKSKTSLYLDEELMRQVKIAGLQRGLSNFTESLHEAMKQWVTAGARQPGPLDGLNRQQRKLVENYIEALRAGIRSDMLDVIAVALAAIARGKEAQ